MGYWLACINHGSSAWVMGGWKTMESGTRVRALAKWQGLKHGLIHSSGAFGMCNEGAHWADKGQGLMCRYVWRNRSSGVGMLASPQQWWLWYLRYVCMWSNHRAIVWNMGVHITAAELGSGLWVVSYLTGKSSLCPMCSKLLGSALTNTTGSSTVKAVENSWLSLRMLRSSVTKFLGPSVEHPTGGGPH